MVLYFKSNEVDPPVTIYMGKDKFENEDLIKYGFPEDVWVMTRLQKQRKHPHIVLAKFHVDKLSSAHVYVRLKPGQTWDEIPEKVVNDCAQLVKANSIVGNKTNKVTIIYTPWANLKKTAGMETGQVTFHNDKKVKRYYVEKRDNDIVNRLNKTKEERLPDLQQEKVEREKMDRKAERQAEFEQKELVRHLAEEKQKAKSEIQAIFHESNMRSNKRDYDVDVDEAEEDFM